MAEATQMGSPWCAERWSNDPSETSQVPQEKVCLIAKVSSGQDPARLETGPLMILDSLLIAELKMHLHLTGQGYLQWRMC